MEEKKICSEISVSGGKKNYSLAIAVGAFNKSITDKMLEAALEQAKQRQIEIVKVLQVPGSYDLPLAVKRLLQSKKVQGVCCLGAIIKGETLHDEVIAHTTAKMLSELSVQFEKPVIYSVSGPGQTREMAIARAEIYGKRTIDSAIQMIEELKF